MWSCLNDSDFSASGVRPISAKFAIGTLDHAEPGSVPYGDRHCRRRHLCRSLFVGAFRTSETAGNQRDHPARQVFQEPLMASVRDHTPRKEMRAAKPGDERFVALFLDMLAAERGADKNTLGAYGRDLGDFAVYLAAIGRTVAKAATGDVRRYLQHLTKRGLRPATVARRLSAIRQLYRFLYAEGMRKDDPAAVIEGPKRTRALPKTLTLAEVDRLLCRAAHSDPGSPLPVRLRAARHPPVFWVSQPKSPPARGPPPRSPRACGARQGQQGAARSAQQRCQRQHGALSFARGRVRSGGRVEMAVPIV